MNHPHSRVFAKICRVFTVAGILSLMVAWFAYHAGARFNRTHSLPKGLYWVVRKPPERGDIVTFWPDDSEPFRMARERGYIIPGQYNDRGAGGYDLMLKKLLALPGDVVSFIDSGVIVNGDLIPNTRPFGHDRIGDPLPVVQLQNYRLREGEALFLSDHLPRSFDARYFGVQHMCQIVEVVVPIWTW